MIRRDLPSHIFVQLLLITLTACGEHVPETKSIWDADPVATPTDAVITDTPLESLPSHVSTEPSSVSTPLTFTLPAFTPQPANTAPAASSRSDDAYTLPSPMPFTPGQTHTEFGIQINGCDKDVPTALAMVKDMGLTWIKQQARWGDMQSAPDRMDWSCLDRVIPAANAAGLKVLISVTTAPAYLRRITRDTIGPPDDFAEFGIFIARLITRYPKQIHAIEMWNEPNLAIEWHDTIDGPKYAQLLAIGYGVTKYLDPSIMVISAGIAPTGFNSLWTSVDDLSFLRGMLDHNAASVMDCIGAHANGPDGVGDIQIVSERYYSLFDQLKPVCLTEFGYALPAEGRAPQGFSWVMGHTVARQVSTLVGGIKWARHSGYVRLVILWNLNFDGTATDVNAPYALMRTGWTSPAIAAIKAALTVKQ